MRQNAAQHNAAYHNATQHKHRREITNRASQREREGASEAKTPDQTAAEHVADAATKYGPSLAAKGVTNCLPGANLAASLGIVSNYGSDGQNKEEKKARWK